MLTCNFSPWINAIYEMRKLLGRKGGWLFCTDSYFRFLRYSIQMQSGVCVCTGGVHYGRWGLRSYVDAERFCTLLVTWEDLFWVFVLQSYSQVGGGGCGAGSAHALIFLCCMSAEGDESFCCGWKDSYISPAGICEGWMLTNLKRNHMQLSKYFSQLWMSYRKNCSNLI